MNNLFVVTLSAIITNYLAQGYELLQLGSSRLLRQSSTDWCSGKVVIVARRMIPLLLGTTAGTQPKCRNGRVSDAVTSELGDRQSSHRVKNLASVLWQVARCCLPRSPGQPQHHKYQNWIWKNTWSCYSTYALWLRFVRQAVVVTCSKEICKS